MKKKVKIPSLSTKQTTTSHFKPLNTKKYYDMWFWKFLAWDMHKNVVGLSQFMGSQPLPPDYRIYNNNTIQKIFTDSLPLQKC
jgi:hypothetical protein